MAVYALKKAFRGLVYLVWTGVLLHVKIEGALGR